MPPTFFFFKSITAVYFHAFTNWKCAGATSLKSHPSSVARRDETEYSAVPKDSILGTVLLVIYINYIYLCLGNFFGEFADDTKIGNAVLSECDRRSQQEDLRQVKDWSVKQEKPFNINKCQILQVGSRNVKKDYEMRGFKIKNIHSIRDLGVTVVPNQVFPAEQRVRQ